MYFVILFVGLKDTMSLLLTIPTNLPFDTTGTLLNTCDLKQSQTSRTVASSSIHFGSVVITESTVSLSKSWTPSSKFKVVVENATQKRTYMKMALGGVGLGLGVKDYRVVMMFD